jgi:hypothetical protein
MMDTAQALLVAVILVLTGLLVLIGFQVVKILREFKRSLEKINKILDDAGIISESVARPVANFSNLFETFTGGLKIIEWLVEFIRDRKTKKSKRSILKLPSKPEPEPEPETEEKESKKEEKKSGFSPRRFFSKKGRRLH